MVITKSAFTLVELMVVVALIGIMTAMILPEMKGTYEEALLRSTSRDLVNALNLAGSRAVSFSQPHRVRLDLAAGRYRIEKRVRDRGREGFVPVADVPGGEGKLDSRITVELQTSEGMESAESLNPAASDNAITFFPDGTADAKEVLLQDRQGFRLALRINATTARVHIVQLEERR